MTYTLLARCPRTGALGVGIATYSLAVGSKCPAIASNVGAMTTQAFVNPTLKALGLRLLGSATLQRKCSSCCAAPTAISSFAK
jgi:uncharacterized Ntn-hydrolase superfamily protein